jgi:predicted 3-demethylubiquinone-9 3-methyltransferase (glyoxalase superfamily)
MKKQKISVCLWFDHQAEEAMNFYTSVFPNSKKGGITRYGEAASKVSGQKKGSVLTATFTLDGQKFVALNGGPIFKFTEAISLIVHCKNQKEVDYYWEKLSKGGHKSRCGWLKDKFGVSWQIVPEGMDKYWCGKDPVKAERAMKALLKMKKLDINALKRAYEGK